MSESNAQEIEFCPGRVSPVSTTRPRFQPDSEDSHPAQSEDHEIRDTSWDAAKPSCEATHALSSLEAPELERRRINKRREAESASEQSEKWRQEVAARINRYRSRRRPRQARYPSLQLSFEAEPEPRSSPAPAPVPVVQPESSPPMIETGQLASAPQEILPEPAAPTPRPLVQEVGRIIEFPRPPMPPPRPLNELADPVIDRPRILDVPDIVPPAPALGGIAIETEPPEFEEKRPGFEIPLQAAPFARRIAAAAIDDVLILLAAVVFGVVFFRVTQSIPPLNLAAFWAAGLLGTLWVCYEYAFLVYSGGTPGARLAKLHLSHFNGSAVSRKMRRWRALAAILSAASLGLGLAWCFLDEDRLCWHDRITRTYLAPDSLHAE